MEKEFNKLSLIEKRKLSIEELCQCNRELRKYRVETNQQITGINSKKLVHPLINFLIEGRRVISGQTVTSYKSVYDKVEKLKSEKPIVKELKKIKEPIIFAITHTGKYDIEIVNEVIRLPYYLLSDDEEYMYRTIDGYITELNGVIYVDSDYPDDLRVGKETAIKVLKQGGNVMWFPEGIWNLSPNQMVLPCKYGIIDAALEADAVIVPIAIDQKDKDFHVNVGAAMYPSRFKYVDKIEAINRLRDQLATLKWQIWEQFNIELRANIPRDYYEKFVAERIAEWPFFTKEAIDKRVFKPSNMMSFEDVLIEPIIRGRKEKEESEQVKILKK